VAEGFTRFASVAEVKNGLSAYLKRASKRKEPVVVSDAFHRKLPSL